ncbi:MAG TPA: lipopolysaccharide biosynthesis protein [Steroidobacteraceae bacterium]|jgi:PST family polysaccharide transporter|nr:lipopolysaccharide biosynthesis protein [Steroidobacteraceae bacterium]
MSHAYFDDSVRGNDLHRRSLRGGAVAMISQGGNVATQVISTIVLARILMPEDFGLVAMVSAITGYISLFVDLGTRDAVAQHTRLSEEEASALFWITAAAGFSFTVVTLSCAPLIAGFYGLPKLKAITMALSVPFMLSALYYQQYALMRRALMFRKLAIIDISGNLIGTALAILLAHLGYGYWALVWKPAITAFVTACGVWATCGWWPGRPAFTQEVKKIVRFGLNVTGFLVAESVGRSLDRVALGHRFGPRELGFYQNALNVYDNALGVSANALHNVATATLSKLRDDVDALKRAWSTALSSLAFFAAPAFAVLAVVGQDLVVLLLGAKWSSAGVILSVIALRGPAQVVASTNSWLHMAAGRPDRWWHWGVLNCGLTIVAVLSGLRYGAIGVAVSFAILAYLIVVPSLLYAGRPLGVRTKDVLTAVGPQIFCALVTAGFGFVLRGMLFAGTSMLVRLIALSFLCSAFYLAIIVLGFRVTKPLAVAASLVRSRARKDA